MAASGREAMISSLVGLVLIVGVGVLAGVVGIKWAIAWLVLLGVAAITTYEPDDDRSSLERSEAPGTAPQGSQIAP
jgi:hypothetical protein